MLTEALTSDTPQEKSEFPLSIPLSPRNVNEREELFSEKAYEPSAGDGRQHRSEEEGRTWAEGFP